jgi:hypothetical protein
MIITRYAPHLGVNPAQGGGISERQILPGGELAINLGDDHPLPL